MSNQTDKEKEAVNRIANLLQKWRVGVKFATAITAITAAAFLLSGCGSTIKVYRPDGTVIVINPDSRK